MHAIFNVIKTATNFDHILHPLSIDKGKEETSLQKRIAGVVAFIFLTLLTLGGAGAFYLYQAHCKWQVIEAPKTPSVAVVSGQSAPILMPAIPTMEHLPAPSPILIQEDVEMDETSFEPEARSLRIIRHFWREHIKSFTLNHGTHIIYRRHFQEHGISATYPSTLTKLISKVGDIWNKHRVDSCLLQYFHWYEQRVNAAQQNKKIALSVSRSVTGEFTVGERRGGEIGKVLRDFRCRVDLKKLAPEEKETISDLDIVLHLIENLPALVVKIHPGCPDLRYARLGPKPHQADFFTLSSFISYLQSYIKKRYAKEWNDPMVLQDILFHEFLDHLNTEKSYIDTSYEFVIDRPVRPEYLEYELRGEHTATTYPPSSEYPKLNFDVPMRLTSNELSKLRIHHFTNLSSLEEYSDSFFDLRYLGNQEYEVIRKKMNRETETFVERIHYWLKEFSCEDLEKQYNIITL